MNRYLVILSICLGCLIGAPLLSGIAAAQDDAPPFQVVLSLIDPPADRVYAPGSDPSIPTPVEMNISLAYDGPGEIMKQGWTDTEFWLLLQFQDEWGRIITSDAIRESTTVVPPPPRVFPNETGALIQGTLVELVNGGWNVSFDLKDPNDANTYYPIAGRSGLIKAQAVIPAATFASYLQTNAGALYAPRYPTDVAKWEGSLKSNVVSFTLVGDMDGDGYYYPAPYGTFSQADCDDRNPDVNPAAMEIVNNGRDDDCNPETPDVVMTETGTVNVTVHRHVVGTGSHPGSSKTGLRGVALRVYSKADGSCARSHGVSWQNYQNIWLDCDEVAGAGETGTDGTAQIETAVGDHLLIGRYKDPEDGSVTYLGVSVGQVEADAEVDKYLQLLITANNKKSPGKATRRTGSDLWIIEPEYVEWSGTEELYPIVFESVGDWSVSTSVAPPEGFVADYETLSEEVDSDLKAVQFTITDVGSDWESPTILTHEVYHKGKKEKIKSKIYKKLSKELAKEKNLTIYGEKTKDKEKISKK